MNRRTALAILIFATTACANPAATDSNERLTIVGDKNITLDEGQDVSLAVRYEDDAGAPLMGEIQLEIVGTVSDASLSANTAVTDDEGIARTSLRVGSSASFEVHATSGAAVPAIWTISVGEGGPAPRRGVEGTYRIDSRFDIVSAIPGDTGTAVEMVIAMSDDPNDPAKFLLDQMLSQVDLGGVEGAIELLRWLIDPALNGMILSNSPQAVQDLLELGDQLGSMVDSFAVVSELDLKEASATHELSGVAFSIAGNDHELTLEELGLRRDAASPTPAAITGDDRVELDEHPIPVPFGPVVIEAMNRVLIPAIAPGRANLGELLVSLIDCTAAGELIATYVPIIGSAEAFAGACELGLTAGATAIEGQIQALAPDLVLEVQGSATAHDENGDGTTDSLVDGEWTGTLRVGEDQFELGRAEFSGERIQ